MRARAQPGLLPARLRYQRKPSAIGPRLAAENPHYRKMVPASTAGAEGDRLYTRTGQASPLLLLDATRLPRAMYIQQRPAHSKPPNPERNVHRDLHSRKVISWQQWHGTSEARTNIEHT